VPVAAVAVAVVADVAAADRRRHHRWPPRPQP